MPTTRKRKPLAAPHPTKLLCVAIGFSLSLTAAHAQTVATLYSAGSDVLPGIGTNLGSPAGGFYDGNYFWIADRASDLSRLTPVAGSLPKAATDFLTAVPDSGMALSSLLIGGTGGLAGQTEFDPVTGIGYVTQARSGRTGRGLVRFQVSGNLATSIVSIATPANLSAAKLSAAVLGPDKNLYLGSSGSGSILRVIRPEIGTTQTVQSIGSTIGGRAVNGLAFVGTDLYIAQTGALSRIRSATTCQSNCQAVVVPGSIAGQDYLTVTADKASGTVYAAQSQQVVSYSPATGLETFVSDSGIYPDGTVQPFNFSKTGASLNLATVDGVPTLWIGDNVATGLTFEGRLWKLSLAADTTPDIVPPVLHLPADILAEATDAAGTVVNFPAATGQDAVSGPVLVTCDPGSGSIFPLGVNAVTCSAADAAGNKATGSFTVTVADTTAPTLNLPASIAVDATSASGAVVLYTANASDSVSGNIPATCNPASGATFPVGVTPVVCSAADGAGNSASATFSVTVNALVPPPDTTAPSLTLPADIAAVATDASGAVVTYTATASDAGAAVPVSCSPASGATFAVGQTPVKCSATDNAGNIASGSFLVTVTPPVVVDTTPPTLTLPADITVEAPSAAGAVVDYAASAVDGAVAVPFTCTPASGATFPVGTSNVSCSATDAAGNVATGSFAVTVTAPPVVPVDSKAPVMTLPLDITLTSSTALAVTYTASAIDDVSGAVPVSCSPASGSTFPVGKTVVNCSASDAAGNVAQGFFNVTVNLPPDTQAPVLTLPGNITTTATSPAGAVVSYTASALDAVSGAVTPSCSPVSGSTFAVGATTVSCSASDAAGNTARGSFTVTVNPQAVATSADLRVGFVISRTRPRAGQTLTIAYTVTNGGPNAANGVTFSDILPSAFRITGVTTTAGTCSAPAAGALGGNVSCALGSLAVNQAATVTMSVTAATPSNVTNTGTATTTTADPNLSNNSGTFFMTIR